MDIDELIQYIFGQSDLQSPTVFHWIKSSTQFAYFAEKYRDKIRDKVRNAQKDTQPFEKLKDVFYELEIGYFLCQTHNFSVEYEKYGNKGPDFTVRDEANITFNVEVKRIRPGDSYQARFDLWKSRLKRQIFIHPSPLALSLKFGDNPDFSLDLVDRLEKRTLEIVKFIINIIPIAEQSILVEGKPDFSKAVPSFENEFELQFRQPPYSTETLANDGGQSPIFKKGDEYRKFYDLYWNTLDQVIPGMINILTIITDSKTHDSWALTRCMQYLNEVAKGNVIEKTKQLSGVLFRGAWHPTSGDPNILWCDDEAYNPIPENIGQSLRKMGDL